MRCTVSGLSLEYCCAYRDCKPRRAAFNRLAEETFALQFEPWYRQGFWQDTYQPYTLFDGDFAAANVSASMMEFWHRGQALHCVQLGTVMTAPAYRGRGLSRFLIEQVLAQWQGRCDFIYLYANDSVLGFYPRFGFRTALEYEDVGFLPGGQGTSVRRLKPDREEDRAVLLRCLRQYGNPFSTLSLTRGEELLMFYAIGPFCDHFWYIESCDTVVVAVREGGTLFCEELFAPAGAVLEDILHALAGPEPCSVRFGFSLRETLGAEKGLLQEEDTTLFILAPEETIFERERLRFPLLSHT